MHCLRSIEGIVFSVCVGMYCYFCHPCFMCTLATQMNECAIGPSQLGWPFETAMRTKLRAMYGIRVSLCDFYAHAEAHALTLRVDWRWITVNKISKNYLSIAIYLLTGRADICKYPQYFCQRNTFVWIRLYDSFMSLVYYNLFLDESEKKWNYRIWGRKSSSISLSLALSLSGSLSYRLILQWTLCGHYRLSWDWVG